MVEVNVNKVKQVYPTHPIHNPLLFNFVEEGAITREIPGGGGTPSLRVSRYAPRFCPPFSASGRSFCPPKFDLVYHFIQILLGPISKSPIFSM